MSTPSVLAFGELLLRLDVPAGVRLTQASEFTARYTGAEANAAASLSRLGIHAELAGVVPDDDLGEACLSALRRYGVGTSRVLRRPGRLGLLFHEPGGVGRAPVVTYDRAGSAFATCPPAAYDWDALLDGQTLLHVSGTAAAVGMGPREALGEAVRAARRRGVRVSLDLNYRASLWSLADAGAALGPLLDQVDVLLGVGTEAAEMFGLPEVSATPDGIGALGQALRERHGVDVVCGTVRAAVDGQDTLAGVLVDADGVAVSAAYPVVDAVGRMGTGDAFAAGVLFGLLSGRSGADSVAFGAAAAHLKQSIAGDVNAVSVAEVEAVLAGAASDRIRR